MTYSRSRNRWRLFAAAALVAALPVAAAAQSDAPAGRSEAGRALTQHLSTLASDTRNVRALIGAGEAALALDDPNAAIGFFGRAEEIDPINGRVKAGLARSLLILEKPRDALRLFDAASSLGVSEADIARDRGLAYDLRGDQQRAQRDYGIALRRGADPEVTRRMALSLAISGNRDQALKLLDPLLYKQDKAAWRARAFVLAMTGDVDGANGIARQVMPGNLARPMAPFFQRLGGLSPAQKAMAVHYGHMPSDGLIHADSDTPVAQSAAVDGALIPAGDALGTRAKDVPAARPAVRVSKEPRRRPGRPDEPRLASVTSAQTGGQAQRAQAPSAEQRPARLETRQETRLNTRIAQAAAGTPGFAVQPIPGPEAKPVLLAATELPAPDPVPVVVTPPAAPAERPSLAAIIGGLELETPVIVAPPVPQTRPKPVAQGSKPADKKAAEKKAVDKKAAKPDPKRAEPARIWAQIATGSNKTALVRDYRKMTEKSPKAFKGMSAWTVPFKGTRRLLVGPFDSQKKAQDFLGKAGLTGFAWTSPAGEAIEKLGLK